MFKVLGLLIFGFVAGYILRSVPVLEKLEKTISWTVLFMLFVFGISIGMNETLIQNLGRFGSQAALLAVCGVFGSLLASYFVYRLLYKKEGGQEDEE